MPPVTPPSARSRPRAQPDANGEPPGTACGLGRCGNGTARHAGPPARAELCGDGPTPPGFSYKLSPRVRSLQIEAFVPSFPLIL